tara:strand:- start:468 stop:884 length:417 start_codon:yes stop_codon:yes gene_type:complete
MLRAVFFSLFTMVISVCAVADVNECGPELKLFGEVSSFYPVPGKKPERRSRFYQIVGNDLSEHMGNFQDIRVQYTETIDELFVEDRRVDLKPTEGTFESQGFRLTEVLKALNKEKVNIKFRQNGRTICEGVYIGVQGD